MTSPLRLLLKDGTKDAQIIDGNILAPGSKFDGLKATESNLMKALDNKGGKETNLENYKMPPPTNKVPNGSNLNRPPMIPGQLDMVAPRQTNPNPMQRTVGPNKTAFMKPEQREQLLRMATMNKLGLV